MAESNPLILVVNPGSTSTKVAVYRGTEEIHVKNVEHPSEELAKFDLTAEQFDLRRQAIEAWLGSLPESDCRFTAIAGRGAPLKPLAGGTYSISAQMLEDVKTSKYSNHASNLGAILADYFSRKYDIPAYITDPITTDNFTEIARISGVPEIKRKCRSHCLNIKAMGRAEAGKIGKGLDEVNFVVAHMGGGISIAALAKGRVIDVNDGLLGMGPFSPDRAGALPIGGVLELAFSGGFSKDELIKKFSKSSGLIAYLGTSDLREVEKMIDDGDEQAKLIFKAMCYQIAKEIGVASVVLKGDVQGIILTGGMAYSDKLRNEISQYVTFIAPVINAAGEYEMVALTEGAIRALGGEETIQVYE
ncbi:MAG: butyrate kinase [candidate division Zixibacteria bacterium]|nr:butyrate kinase [candidate division Zixibacteria bacterium]